MMRNSKISHSATKGIMTNMNSILTLHDTSLNTITNILENINATGLDIIKIDIETIKTDIIDHDTSLNTIETNIDTINGNITVHDTSLNTIETNIDTINGNITVHDTSLNTIETNIETINGSITLHDTSLNNIETNIDTINGNITIHDTSLNNIYSILDNIVKEPTFNTIVLRNTGVTGTTTINLKEIQLWINNINVLPANGIIPPLNTPVGYFKGESEFIYWNTKQITSSYQNTQHASNSFNNLFPAYDSHTGTENFNNALVISLSQSFNIKDIQSIVYYGRPGFESRSQGLAFELYDYQGYFTIPIVQTPEIRSSVNVNVRFDFPEIVNYTGNYANSDSTSQIINSTLIYNITNLDYRLIRYNINILNL